MSDLMVSNVVKMNSLEIAKLVGCRHANIKRSIKRLAKRGAIRQPSRGFIERINNLGFTVKDEVYVFEGEQGKRDSIIVVAQNHPELMARIVDRWQELEKQVQQNAPAIPQTLSEALRLAADLAEEKERLALVNKELAPKAAVCDAIVKNDMHRTASEVGKALGMSAIKLNRKLEAVGVYDLRCRRRVFSQWFIDEGYGEMRVTHDGYEQAVFTAKGQVWITKLFVCD